MSRPFIVKYPGKRCPRCKLPIAPGETAQFERVDWPWGENGVSSIYASPRDLRVWHSTCVNLALREALCPACSMLHKNQGMCLL